MLIAGLFLLLKFSLIFAVTCPGGGNYEADFNRCYIYFNQPATFLAAESTCRSIGGNLAEIRNGFENTYIAAFVYNDTRTSSTTYWIGANLLMAPKWTFTTNNTALYTNWAAGEPPDPSSFDCASVMSDTYLWKKELCYSTRPFVIRPVIQTISNMETNASKLTTGFTNLLTYSDASIICRNENATLPKVTSVGIQNFLEGFIFNGKSNIWLGLMCRSTNANECKWWDGTLVTYLNFASSPGGACPVGMFVDNGLWDTVWTFWPFASSLVCQKPVRRV